MISHLPMDLASVRFTFLSHLSPAPLESSSGAGYCGYLEHWSFPSSLWIPVHTVSMSKFKCQQDLPWPPSWSAPFSCFPSLLFSLHLVVSFLQLTVSASLDAEHDSTVRWYLSSQKQTSNSKATIHLMLNCSTLVTLGMGAWRTGAVWYLLNGISRTSLDVQLWNKCGRLHTLRSYISWCGQKKREYVGRCYVASSSGSKLHRAK